MLELIESGEIDVARIYAEDKEAVNEAQSSSAQK
jgi:hypothetical protein